MLEFSLKQKESCFSGLQTEEYRLVALRFRGRKPFIARLDPHSGSS